MNTYFKFAPNVFLAKCKEEHKKGETIIVETQYGKENESIVFNLIYKKDGYYYYSIVRADGFNVQEWVKRKVEKYQERAANAIKKSNDYFEKSNRDKEFLSLGEPIKVGHHSERGHRKMIDNAWNNMGKSVHSSEKAAECQERADRWSNKTDIINLSMPESIEYYENLLNVAKEYHEGLKSGKYPREHSFSLPYAKKAVNEAQKNYDLSIRLWGDNNE